MGGLYGFYKRFIKPRTLKVKLQKVVRMITDWFDEIDCNLNTGINMDTLNNREDKIRDYIARNLEAYQIKPSRKIMQQWNQRMGLKEECWNEAELFQKYSRIPAEGMHIDIFFHMLVANFLKFYRLYQQESSECNFAEVKMPVKFLKFYAEALGYEEPSSPQGQG